MWAGVRPIICRACSPTACTSPIRASIATTDGSNNTTPSPRRKTTVFAVPRSTASCRAVPRRPNLTPTSVLGPIMTPFRLQRLDHVSLNVSDRQRSIDWYHDVLGLTLTNEPRRDDWPAFMGDFGACIALFQGQPTPPAERSDESVGFRHVAFMVGKHDLERAQAHLAELGVTFRFEDHGDSHSVY